MYPSQVGAFVSLESYWHRLVGRPDYLLSFGPAVLSEIMFTWGAISAPFAPLFARKHSHTHVQRSQSGVEGTRAIQEGCEASARHKCGGCLVPGVAFNIRDPRVAFTYGTPGSRRLRGSASGVSVGVSIPSACLPVAKRKKKTENTAAKTLSRKNASEGSQG